MYAHLKIMEMIFIWQPILFIFLKIIETKNILYFLLDVHATFLTGLVKSRDVLVALDVR